MTAIAREDLVIDGASHLRSFTSASSDAGARRGFCGRCGSSLFWDAPDRSTISISAGTLDGASGLRTIGHIYVSQAGDYYEVPADGTPHHPLGR
jgi:hypothetical protein